MIHDLLTLSYLLHTLYCSCVAITGIAQKGFIIRNNWKVVATPSGTWKYSACSFVSSTHCIAVFSTESMRSGLSKRLSKVINVPVTLNDGLSQYICRPCNRKFLAPESLGSRKEVFQQLLLQRSVLSFR